jgi:DNA-binding beta-propeller fold protein YncE
MSTMTMPLGVALRRLSAALAMAVAALAVLSAASALAVTSTPRYTPGTFVGGLGAANGQFQSPGSIAVEPGTHNVLVADTGNARVQVLAPSGDGLQFVTAFGAGTLTAPFGLAVDQVSGAVYVTDTDAGAPVIRRYTSDGATTPTYTLDPDFTSPAIVSARSTLAVDPTTHELLVADTGTQEVKRFDVGDGHLVSSFNGSTSAGGPFSSLRSVAVAPSGTVYVVDEPYLDSVFLQPGVGRVERFDAAGASLDGALPGMDQVSAVSVDGVTGLTLVGWNNAFYEPTRRVSLFSAAGVLDTTLDLPDVAEADEPGIVGLAYDQTGPHDIFALLDRSVGEHGVPGVQRFALGAVPGVAIGPANSVTATTAQVTGTVAPGVASGAATVHFEYSYAGGTEQVTADQTVPGAPGETTVSAELVDLRPSTTYTVRLHASNDDFSAVSTVGTFTTGGVSPIVQDAGVTDRTAHAAVLNGRVNPRGGQTVYHFEYGETAAYGSSVPVGDEDVAGNGYAFRQASHLVSGLKPQTTYHYRLVARNATGTSATPDATFTTRPANEPVRAYEQVTPVDKGGAVLNTYGYYHARADGDALAYQTKNAMDLPGTQGSPLQSRYASRRTSKGWDLRPLDAPQNPVPVPELLGASTIAMSPDFSHALVSSNRKLAPGAVEGAGNLYRRNVETGAYDFIATGLEYGLLSGPSGANIFYGGSPDFSKIALQAYEKLTPNAQEGVNNLYQWTHGQDLQLISRMPDGSSTDGFLAISSRLSWPARNYVTADGSQLFFATQFGSAGGIYRTQGGVTERILDPGAPVQVVDVTPDGRYVVYLNDATSDLYRYDTSSGVSTLVLSGVYVGGGIGYMGISANGASIFSSGGGGGSPVVWHDGDTAEIGFASGFEGIATWGVAASPNGRYFVFATTSLEGQDYDNTGCTFNPVDGEHGGHCYEVYVYDVEQQALTCASCPADGSRSTGHAHLGPSAVELSLHGGRFVNDDGEAFFTTPTKLVAADTNGTNDVYMYQDGEVQLISPGTGKHNATLADVSANGDDVFFITDEQLVGQDRDDQLDMYDARVGGGIASQSDRGDGIAPCGGPECREPTAGPTAAPAVASQTASALSEPIVAGAKAKVSVLKVTPGSSSLRVRLRVSGRGVVRLSSKSVTTKAVTVSRAGTYTVEAKWTKKTRSARRAKRRVRVEAKVSLTPPFGTTAVARFKRTLGK